MINNGISRSEMGELTRNVCLVYDNAPDSLKAIALSEAIENYPSSLDEYREIAQEIWKRRGFK